MIRTNYYTVLATWGERERRRRQREGFWRGLLASGGSPPPSPSITKCRQHIDHAHVLRLLCNYLPKEEYMRFAYCQLCKVAKPLENEQTKVINPA